MNVRSVTRGDAAVALAALLLMIASFLPFLQANNCTGSNCSVNAWHSALFPLLPSVYIAGFVGGLLVVFARFLPQGQRVVGLQIGQWGIALTVFAAWSALWAVFSETQNTVGHGMGAWLGLLFALALAAASVATVLVPALSAPLLPEGQARPAAQPYPAGASAVGAQQPGLYAYAAPPAQQQAAPYQQPAPMQEAQPTPAAQPQPTRQQEPQQLEPQEGAPAPGPQLLKEQEQAAPAGAAPMAPFAPFWFAVPAVRRLAPESDPSGMPVGELTPGVWYLAVDERGGALVAQTQDGKRGLLTDTSGIQRG